MPGPEQDHVSDAIRRSDTKESPLITEDYTLLPHETMARVVLPAEGEITVSLPSTGAANGRKYAIYVEATLGVGTCECEVPDDGIQGADPINPTALASVGDCWGITNWGGRFWELSVDDVDQL